MMKKSKRFIVSVCAAACAAIVCFSLGVSGVISLAKEEETIVKKDKAEKAQEDELIGVFVTKGPLGGEEDIGDILSGFGFEVSEPETEADLSVIAEHVPEYEDTLSDDTQMSYPVANSYKKSEDGRFYAELTEDEYGHKRYVFPDRTGILYYECVFKGDDGKEDYTDSEIDEAFIRTKNNSSEIEDEKEINGDTEITYKQVHDVELMLYLTESEFTVFCNPVYRTSDGRVYARDEVTGVWLGGGFGQTFNGRCEVTGSDGKSRIRETNITVTVNSMDDPGDSFIMQYDNNNTLLKKEKYASGDFPSEFTTLPETTYIAVENDAERKLYQKGENIETFSSGDDFGFKYAYKQYCQVDWGAKSSLETYH